jgi:hypothetical protein
MIKRESSAGALLSNQESARSCATGADGTSSRQHENKGVYGTTSASVLSTGATLPVVSTNEVSNSNGDVSRDGPCHPYSWRRDGKKIVGRMQPAAWRMVNHLWTHVDRAAEFKELKLPVYGDREHTADANAFGSLRRAANSFFKKHCIPWRVQLKSRLVSLEYAES